MLASADSSVSCDPACLSPVDPLLGFKTAVSPIFRAPPVIVLPPTFSRLSFPVLHSPLQQTTTNEAQRRECLRLHAHGKARAIGPVQGVVGTRRDDFCHPCPGAECEAGLPVA